MELLLSAGHPCCGGATIRAMGILVSLVLLASCSRAPAQSGSHAPSARSPAPAAAAHGAPVAAAAATGAAPTGATTTAAAPAGATTAGAATTGAATTGTAATGTATAGAADLFPDKMKVDYATGFRVSYHGTYKIVEVTRPWPGAMQHFTYLLVERGTQPPKGYPQAIRITVPVRRVVALSDSYLGEIKMLKEIDTLVGIQTASYIYSKRIRALAASGAVKQVGEGDTTNLELILALNPDLVLTEGYGGAGELYPKLIEAGLPVVLDGDWAELTPLGGAEWLKFIALFYDREGAANTLFDRTAAEYHRLERLASRATSRPTVFVNAPWEGTWGMPGGQSYVAALLRDAGANYLWSNTSSDGTLFLDLESVFARAATADFWLNTGDWTKLADATAADPRFAGFRAFRLGNLYNYVERTAPPDANDYWETGPAQPQVVLADLIRIFHPALVPGHSLYFYRRLP